MKIAQSLRAKLVTSCLLFTLTTITSAAMLTSSSSCRSLVQATSQTFLLPSLFPKYAGVSFAGYVTEGRIAKAKELTASGGNRIHLVAKKPGFESAFCFFKVFSKVTGISPGDYISSLHKEG